MGCLRLSAAVLIIAIEVIAENDISTAFRDNGIVPDVIPTAPTAEVFIKYPSGIDIVLGKEVTPTQVMAVPTVSWEISRIDSQYYTLMMIDPDAPSRQSPDLRCWQHWLVVNIPSHNLTGGSNLSQYVGAGPSKDTGLHRYVFLVYKQPSKLDFDEPLLNNTSAAGRSNFSVVKFAEKYKLGNPVAGNFFQTSYDDSVPKLLAQLGLSSGVVLKPLNTVLLLIFVLLF